MPLNATVSGGFATALPHPKTLIYQGKQAFEWQKWQKNPLRVKQIKKGEEHGVETQKQKEVEILATFATTATKTPANTRFHLVATLWQPMAKPATQVAKTHLFNQESEKEKQIMQNTAHNYATTSRAYREAFKNLVCHNKVDVVNLREGSNSHCHYFPQDIAKAFNQGLTHTFPLRALAQVEEGTIRDTLITTESRTIAEWAEENSTIADRMEPPLSELTQRLVSPTRLHALTSMLQETLSDQPHLVEVKIAAALGEAMGEKLEAATVQKIQEVTGQSIIGHLDTESIKKVYFNQPAHQRMNSVWIMNDHTLLELAGLEIAGGQPLVDMASMTVLGRPIVITQSMPNPEAGSMPVAFLNPKRLRMIEPDHPALRVIREKWAVQGHIGFMCTMRSETIIDRPDHVSLLTIQ